MYCRETDSLPQHTTKSNVESALAAKSAMGLTEKV